jgi:hypothetical protein
MSCQACERPAAHIARTHGCAAHCCSPACAHALYAGITALPGNTHYAVSAASPLGRAVNRGNLVVPQSTLATLIGALQRVGPQMKRGADAAELDASTQAAAPVPVDWTVALPADAWGEILRRLERTDLANFGAINTRTAALAQADPAQVALRRRELTNREAAARYANPYTSDEERRLLRRAFDHVAEMALALLLVLDLELLDRLNFSRDFDLYEKRLRELLVETERNGPAIFVRPLHYPTTPNPNHGRSGAPIRVMVGAINFWLGYYMVDFQSVAARQLLRIRRNHVALFDSIRETPESDSLFAFLNTDIPGNQDGLPWEIVRDSLGGGVDPRRPDAGAALCQMDFSFRANPRFVEFLRDNNVVLDSPPNELGFRPINYALINDNLEWVIQTLELQGRLYDVLAERTATQKGPQWLREPIMFGALEFVAGQRVSSSLIMQIARLIVPAADRLKKQGYPSLFLQRNQAGLTPLAAYLAENVFIPDSANDWSVHKNMIVWAEGGWEPWEIVNGRPAIMYASDPWMVPKLIERLYTGVRHQPATAAVREFIFAEIIKREAAHRDTTDLQAAQALLRA